MEIIEFLTDWAWVVWLVLIALFIVIEMFTLEFTCLMLALGSTAGLVVSLTGAEFWLQVVVAAVIGVLLILFLRPPLLARLSKNADPAKSNVDALIGMHGMVVETVTTTSGQVKLQNGDTWTARTGYQMLSPQTPVVVSAINGAVAVVVPVNATASQ